MRSWNRWSTVQIVQNHFGKSSSYCQINKLQLSIISYAQWKEHFENLFKQDDTVNDQNIVDLFEEEPAADEIEDSIFLFRNI